MIRSVESAIALLLTKVTKGAVALISLKKERKIGWVKNVQISYELFMMLIRFHLCNDDLWKEDIDTELEKKLDAIVNRNLYTQYKIAPTKEEQEKARTEYLDRKGYHKDWRW